MGFSAGSLGDKISQEDKYKRDDMMNQGSFSSGFDDADGGGSDLGFGDDDGFDMGDIFGGDSSSGGGFGGDSFGSDPFGGGGSSSFGSDPFGSSGGGFGSDPFGGGSTFGNNNGFGNNSFGNSSFGSFGNNGFGNNGFGNNGFGSFGQQGMMNQQGMMGQQGAQANQKEDIVDKLVETGAETAKNIGDILLDTVKSVKERSADDYGYLGRNMILTGIAMIPIGIFLGIIGGITEVHFLSFAGISTQLALAGGLALTTGVTSMGAAAFVLTKIGDSTAYTVDDIPEIPANDETNVIDSYEANLGDELDDLFGDDFDAMFSSEPDPVEDSVQESEEDIIDDGDDEPLGSSTDIYDSSWIDGENDSIDDIQENRLISRDTLFNAFKSKFPPCTPGFADSSEIDPQSEEFRNLETVCLKALANIANCEMEEVKSHLESATESFFSYTLKLKRFNKVKNCDTLASELEVYMKENSDDDSVNATVSIEGDFYRIIVTKGVTAVVSFGDAFKKQSVCDFYLDTKNKMPIITGINELGTVMLEDAKKLDTMMICGKPRSGKSWYVLSILSSLMLFNSPEEVQFIIIDPKKSQLFKTLSLMPHVCGLHDDTKVLSILDDIIDVEAPRRKKILNDHKCDDIWALREAGVMMPVLYVVIDEYITVKNNLDADKQKELNSKIQTLISQLPSQGIRLIFIPHRSTGIVDKTNRSMIQYIACVRSTTEDVMDALDIKGWKRALTKPGDIALKSSEMKNAAYARGAALTADDRTNTKFIEMAAKAFYKMGVDMPDMSVLRIACNRDEDAIRQELGGESTRIQYNAATILDSFENLELE